MFEKITNLLQYISYVRVLLVLSITLVLFFSIDLRMKNLDKINPFIADEVSFLLAGTSLMDQGIPTSWSMFSSRYHKTNQERVKFNNSNMRVVKPYLDHPPLFSIIISCWLKLQGSDYAEVVDWRHVRTLMVIISFLSIIALFLLVLKVFNLEFAIFSLLAISFFPSHVLASRFATPENLIALFLSLSLLVVYSDQEKKRLSLLTLSALCIFSYLAPLMKLSGVVVSLANMLFAFFQSRFKLALLFLLSGLLSCGTFFLYASFFDLELFENILDAHHSRSQSFFHFWSFFTNLNLGRYHFPDPAMIAGLIGLIILCTSNSDRKKYFLISPVLSIILVFSYVAPIEQYGWYKYIAYPLIALGLANIYKDFFNGKAWTILLLIPLILATSEQAQITDLFHSQRTLILMTAVACLLPVFLFNYSERIAKTFAIIPLTFLFYSQFCWLNIVLNKFS